VRGCKLNGYVELTLAFFNCVGSGPPFQINKVYHMAKLGSANTWTRVVAITLWKITIWVGETISRVEEPYTHAGIVGNIICSLFHNWYVLEFDDSLREFGERGVNHLLCPSSVTLWLQLQYWWGPPGSPFSYLSRSPLHCSRSEGWTSACIHCNIFWVLLIKGFGGKFLCGIHRCWIDVFFMLNHWGNLYQICS